MGWRLHKFDIWVKGGDRDFFQDPLSQWNSPKIRKGRKTLLNWYDLPAAPARAKLFGKSPVIPAPEIAGPVLNPPSKNTGSDMEDVLLRRVSISFLFICSHELKFFVVTEKIIHSQVQVT